MSDSLTKCKVISFRVSDDEYRKVDAASKEHGFTSVSLFARSATLMRNTFEPVSSPIDQELRRLWERIEVLTAALEQITSKVFIKSEPPSAN